MAWVLVSGMKDTPDRIFPIKGIPALKGCINPACHTVTHRDITVTRGGVCQKGLTGRRKRECNTTVTPGFSENQGYVTL